MNIDYLHLIRYSVQLRPERHVRHFANHICTCEKFVISITIPYTSGWLNVGNGITMPTHERLNSPTTQPSPKPLNQAGFFFSTLSFEGNSSIPGVLPSQRARAAESISTLWRHREVKHISCVIEALTVKTQSYKWDGNKFNSINAMSCFRLHGIGMMASQQLERKRVF